MRSPRTGRRSMAPLITTLSPPRTSTDGSSCSHSAATATCSSSRKARRMGVGGQAGPTSGRPHRAEPVGSRLSHATWMAALRCSCAAATARSTTARSSRPVRPLPLSGRRSQAHGTEIQSLPENGDGRLELLRARCTPAFRELANRRRGQGNWSTGCWLASAVPAPARREAGGAGRHSRLEVFIRRRRWNLRRSTSPGALFADMGVATTTAPAAPTRSSRATRTTELEAFVVHAEQAASANSVTLDAGG